MQRSSKAFTIYKADVIQNTVREYKNCFRGIDILEFKAFLR
jgi:hypothetical protein